ncbi:MAG: hypothetical protein R2711_14585 [Acidimicrobiales bacterium]
MISPSSPPGSPYIGGRWRPWRIGMRPVSRVARLGVQLGSLYALVSCMPRRASASMFGVGAPTATPPP